MQVTNQDLLRQLEKWRNIENREGGELETIRKRKIELEIQVQEYETRLTEAEKAQLQLKTKHQARILQFKASPQDHIVRSRSSYLWIDPSTDDLAQAALDEANKDLDQRDSEIEDLKSKLSEAEAQLAGLDSKAGSSRAPASPKQKVRRGKLVGIIMY